MHDTWAARDLPVLEAAVRLLEQSYLVTVTDIAARTGFEIPVVARALDALDPEYVDFRKTTTGGDARFWYVYKVTPAARRAVGQWPTARALVRRLADELTAAAQQETDSDRHALLIYAARLIGDTLRDVTERAATHVLTPALGEAELAEPEPLPFAEAGALPDTTAPEPEPLPEGGSFPGT